MEKDYYAAVEAVKGVSAGYSEWPLFGRSCITTVSLLLEWGIRLEFWVSIRFRISVLVQCSTLTLNLTLTVSLTITVYPQT